tara:strand:+ start:324 stop:647 length:324 start_codon:yes stop_codon:yes gene_type:complete
MSLDVMLVDQKSEVIYEANITHNLGEMAKEALIYDALWRPENIRAIHAKHIIRLLEEGLHDLENEPSYFEQFNPKNGWGSYEVFVSFVEKYLNACKENPTAEIQISR